MICWCRYEQCRVPRMQYLRGLCFQKGEEEKEERRSSVLARSPGPGDATGARCVLATVFTDIATATCAESAGAILKYVGLPAPGREKTASGDQIVDPNK